MKFIEVSRTIQATPAVVWSVLTNPQTLTRADTGVARIDGQIAKGHTFLLRTDVAPRDFRITVCGFEPDTLMVWKSGMPLRLFTGIRRFSLASRGSSTNFRMREEFTGPLLPVIWKSMPDLKPSFEKFADAIKQLSESKPA